MNKYLISLLGLLLALTGCARKELKVMATTTPHAQMLNFVAPDLKAQRIDLTVIITDNYALPNEALANKDVDANFFQDGSFLATEVTRYGYPLVSLTAVEIEPMGFYSNKIKSIDKLADNATIAVADDPSNQARALILLQQKRAYRIQCRSSATARHYGYRQKSETFEVFGIPCRWSLPDAHSCRHGRHQYQFCYGSRPLPDKRRSGGRRKKFAVCQRHCDSQR